MTITFLLLSCSPFCLIHPDFSILRLKKKKKSPSWSLPWLKFKSTSKPLIASYSSSLSAYHDLLFCIYLCNNVLGNVSSPLNWMTQKDRDCSNLFATYSLSTSQFSSHNSYFIGLENDWIDPWMNSLSCHRSSHYSLKITDSRKVFPC